MGHALKRPISVLVTEECNLRCDYCLTSSLQFQKNPLTIDMDFVKQGIKDYFAGNPARELRIYSVGESTTHIDTVKNVIDYARSISDSRVYVELQTNGYFSEETAEWVAKNIDYAWVSLDGTPEIHDVYRKTDKGKGSSEVVVRNIKYLADKIEVGIRSTTTDINIARQKELLDYSRSLGVMKVATKPVLNPVGTAKDKWSIDLMEYARYFLEAWKYAQTIGIYYTCVFVFNFDQKTEYACRACFPTPHLTPDGYVSACDRAFLGDTPLQDLIYGKWAPDEHRIIYDIEKIERIRQRRPEVMEKCQACKARDYCAGNCMGTGYQETGNLFGIPDRYCEAILFLFENLKPYKDTCTYAGGHP